MDVHKLFDRIYLFIEKYFYFIVGVIVFALVSLTASLYAQDYSELPQDNDYDAVQVRDIGLNNFETIKLHGKTFIKAKQKSTDKIRISIQRLGDDGYETIASGQISEKQSLVLLPEFDSNLNYRICFENLTVGSLEYSYVSWSKIAKRYRLEVWSAKPKLT